MTIEQPPELNRFVDLSIPLTWEYRWRQFKMTLPIWGFIWLCYIEMGVTKAWFADRLTWGFIWILPALCLLLMALALGGAEIQIRTRQRSKRVLQIKERKIVVKPAKESSIRWKHISKFQFEPVATMPGLTILKIFCFNLKKAPAQHARWSMVLDKTAPMTELIGCLQMKRVTTSSNFEIKALQTPLPNEPVRPFPMLGMSMSFGGLYLLLHGMPVLLFAIFGGHSGDDSSSSGISEAKKAWLGHLIASHFSTMAQFRHFMFWLGLSLTGLGLVFLVWGSSLMRRKPYNAPQ